MSGNNRHTLWLTVRLLCSADMKFFSLYMKLIILNSLCCHQLLILELHVRMFIDNHLKSSTPDRH